VRAEVDEQAQLEASYFQIIEQLGTMFVSQAFGGLEFEWK
jgi:hypothetical protein